MANGMTISTHRGDITVVFTLYGNVNEERAKRERALCDHRVEQLSWKRPTPKERRGMSEVERVMMRMAADYSA